MSATTMSDRAIDELGTRAAEQAMRGAVEILFQRQIKSGDRGPAELDRLVGLIREELQGALPAPLSDAREAHACGMGGFAVATFGASMMLAGVHAAQRWLGERA